MGELYDVDVSKWSEHQARLLRQHAAGELGNEAPDWIKSSRKVKAWVETSCTRLRAR